MPIDEGLISLAALIQVLVLLKVMDQHLLINTIGYLIKERGMTQEHVDRMITRKRKADSESASPHPRPL